MSKISNFLRLKFKGALSKNDTQNKNVLNSNVMVKYDLRITQIRLNGINHSEMIQLGSHIYKSAKDFSTDEGWVKYWGNDFRITFDIYGNYVVYLKERFPLFDISDRIHDGRHYRVILPCKTKVEAERKLEILRDVNNIGSLNYYIENKKFFEKMERYELLPLVYYQDDGSLWLYEKS